MTVYVLLMVLLLLTSCSAFYVYLTEGKTSCFYHELGADDTVVVHYRCPSLGRGLGIRLVVADPEGYVIDHDLLSKAEDSFEISGLNIPGEHSVCFTLNSSLARGEAPPKFSLEIIRGTELSQKTGVMLASMESVQHRVMQLRTEFGEVLGEMRQTRQRTDLLRAIAEVTRSRVLLLGGVQVLLLILSAAQAMQFLKRFLVAKKLV